MRTIACIVTVMMGSVMNLSAQKLKKEHEKALASRSDSIDIIHYNLYLDITNDAAKWIRGYAQITLTAKLSNQLYVDFDLLKLQVDSVIDASQGVLTYAYNDTLLRVYFPSALNVGDTAIITLYYQGSPVMDPSGWGGFYYQGGYIFNLGVGFQDIPHSYGRVWHPCFDNFVEKATYTFTVMSDENVKAHCNGVLVSETLQNDTTIRVWQMTDPIPSYLACVAAAGYATVHLTFTGQNGLIPVEYAAKPADTVKVKNSFVNLPACLQCYEEWYGPYVWQKIGYSMVPFSSGAMEHATNIAYPVAAANGSLTYEDVMAHEFSHHWWGDLVTCDKAEEMWINEGFAEYSSHLFFDCVYGHNAYLDKVRANHREVIHYAHLKEGGFLALSNIPQTYTYGDHVYNKGASVVHNLRTYMGDSLFKVGMKAVMQAKAFQNINSQELKAMLENATGLNLQSFFNGWVYNGGFPDFSLDSVSIVPQGGSYLVTLYVAQKLRGAPGYFYDVPLEVSCYDNNWNKQVEKIMVGGPQTQVQFILPFAPAFVCLNEDNGLNLAISDGQKVIRTPGSQWIGLSRMNVTVKNVTDSALLRIEHHWAAPDPIQNNSYNLTLSQSRYFVVDGLWPADFSASAYFFYDARNLLSGGNGNLDNDLASVTEDSLLLLYRPDRKHDWIIYPYYTKDYMGPANNKYGKIIIDSLLKGEYTLANGAIALPAQNALAIVHHKIRIYPNPAEKNIRIEFPEIIVPAVLYLTDVGGRIWIEKHVHVPCRSLELDIDSLPTGLYMVSVMDEQQNHYQGRFVKK